MRINAELLTSKKHQLCLAETNREEQEEKRKRVSRIKMVIYSRGLCAKKKLCDGNTIRLSHFWTREYLRKDGTWVCKWKCALRGWKTHSFTGPEGPSICAVGIDMNMERETSPEEDGEWNGLELKLDNDLEPSVLDSQLLWCPWIQFLMCGACVSISSNLETLRNVNSWPSLRSTWVEVQKTEF